MNIRKASEPKVVIVTELCDTSEAMRQADGVLSHLKVHFDGEIRFDLRLWRVDLLDLEIAFDWACRDVAVSDLLAIAFGAMARIPDPLKELVHEWSKGNPNMETSLVALTPSGDMPEKAANPLRNPPAKLGNFATD